MVIMFRNLLCIGSSNVGMSICFFGMLYEGHKAMTILRSILNIGKSNVATMPHDMTIRRLFLLIVNFKNTDFYLNAKWKSRPTLFGGVVEGFEAKAKLEFELFPVYVCLS